MVRLPLLSGGRVLGDGDNSQKGNVSILEVSMRPFPICTDENELFRYEGMMADLEAHTMRAADMYMLPVQGSHLQ